MTLIHRSKISLANVEAGSEANVEAENEASILATVVMKYAQHLQVIVMVSSRLVVLLTCPLALAGGWTSRRMNVSNRLRMLLALRLGSDLLN